MLKCKVLLHFFLFGERYGYEQMYKYMAGGSHPRLLGGRVIIFSVHERIKNLDAHPTVINDLSLKDMNM